MKRVLSLCLLMTLILTSCGSSYVGKKTTAGESTTSTAPETIDPAFESALPAEYDLGGYEITVARRSHEKNYWALGTFAFAEETGEALDDAIYRRNLAATEKYNFTLKEVNFDSDPVDKVNASVLAGDDEYRIAMIEMSSASKAVGGSYLNLYDLEWLAPEKAWWDQNIQRDLTVNGRLYMLTGDILVADNDAMMMTMYNRPLADDYKFENLYNAVRDGRWTYDLMISLAKQVSGDLNGDGKYDENDRYGLMYVNNASAEPYFASTCTYLYQIRNGEPELTLYSERMVDSWQKLISFIKTDSAFSILDNLKQFEDNNADSALDYMLSGHHALYGFTTVSVVLQLRSSDADFGIIPHPKFDEAQKNYIVSPHSYGNTLLTVPVTTRDPDRTGFILEAFSAKSAEIVTPAFYDKTLIGKSTRDDESAEMLELIFSSKKYDIGNFFAWGDLTNKVMTAWNKKNENIASVYQGAEAKALADIDKIKELFE